MISSPHTYQDALDAVQKGLSQIVDTSRRNNALYGTDDVHRHMMWTCVHNAQNTGCAKSSRGMEGTGSSGGGTTNGG